MTSFSFFLSNADSASTAPGSFNFGSTAPTFDADSTFSFFLSNADSASTAPGMKLDSIGIGSFNFGSTAPTFAMDHCHICRSKIKQGMCEKGSKWGSPSTNEAPIFQSQSLASSFTLSTGASPNGLFPGCTSAASSSSSVVSSETKSTADEIKQNKATRKANKEPVTNSPLPLTLISRIFYGIPQNPHFYQLRDYSELTRKKLMFAWDQIFEETVNEIHSLRTVDFWVTAKKLWKTMEELQNLGYNVIGLRKRLVELTDVMMELKLSQSVIKRLKIKAQNHGMEKSRLESLIVNLQTMAKREADRMENKLIVVAKLENDLPKFDAAFAKLAMDPL